MISGTIAHAIMICIFYLWLDMGYRGVILATGLMFFVRACVNISLVEMRNDVRKHSDVHFFSKETVTNLGPLFFKSLSSMFLGVWGWWSFDIFTLMATYIGPAAAGGQTIMRSIGLLTFMMPASFSSSAAITIGKSIGEERNNLAM
jgi:Na+-driven multidrug efflux pump